jgi:hypothetical protein
MPIEDGLSSLSRDKEYCAWTLAIGLTLRSSQGTVFKWDHTEFVANARCSTYYTAHPNLHMNEDAMHQGMSMFKKAIRSDGHELITVHSRGLMKKVKGFADYNLFQRVGKFNF